VTTTEHANVVDQIFFKYDYSADGLSVGASSLARPEDEVAWLSLLKERLRLTPTSTNRLPSGALSYLVVSDQMAVVMWRYANGPTAGRNDSLALLGRRDVLTPDVATGLWEWPGWSVQIPPEGRLPQVFPSHLSLTRERRTEIEAEAAQHDSQREATAVLARMLAEPRLPVSIWGNRTSPIALMRTVRAAGEEALRSRGAAPLWTFSTWEVRHDNGVTGLPEIVFLPEPQTGALASVDRVQVDLGAAEVVNPDGDFAHGLVNARFVGGPQPVDPWLTMRRTEARGSEQRSSRDRSIEAAQAPAGAVQQPVAAATRPADSPTTNLTSAGAQTPQVNGGQAPATADRRPAAGGRQQTWTSDPKVEKAKKAARRLLEAKAGGYFVTSLADLERTVKDAPARGQVRAQLEALGGWERLADSIDGRFRQQHYDFLIDATFGPDAADVIDYPKDAGKDAASLISSTQYPVLAHRLTQRIRDAAAKRSGAMPPAVTEAIVERFAQQGRAPESTGVAHRLKQTGRVLARRGFWQLLAGAVVLAALAFLAGGLFWGRNDSGVAVVDKLQDLQTSVDALQGTGSSGSTTNAVPALPAFPWRVTVEVPENQRVAVFVKTKDGKYLGAFCAGDIKPADRSVMSCPDPRKGSADVVGAAIVVNPDPQTVGSAQAALPGQPIFELPAS
jgi:hypothetical protein